jgi:hypothetical protein
LWEDNKSLTHGEWAKPVWPKSRSLQGSPPTPYIYDDRCDWYEAADAIEFWYNMTKEQRKECGFKGHEWVCSDDAMMSARHMCQLFKDHMNTAFEKWTPRERYEVYKV